MDVRNEKNSVKNAVLSEEELALGLINKDVFALKVLYKYYSENLLGVISRIIKGEEANDVLQTVFIKVWLTADKYDPKKGRLFTWLLNVARNCALDTLRSKRYKDAGMSFLIDDYEGFLEHRNPVWYNTDTIGIRDMVARLEPKVRDVVVMTYFKGYTHEEAAKELNIPLGTLKTRIKYALAELLGSFKKEVA